MFSTFSYFKGDTTMKPLMVGSLNGAVAIGVDNIPVIGSIGIDSTRGG